MIMSNTINNSSGNSDDIDMFKFILTTMTTPLTQSDLYHDGLNGVDTLYKDKRFEFDIGDLSYTYSYQYDLTSTKNNTQTINLHGPVHYLGAYINDPRGAHYTHCDHPFSNIAREELWPVSYDTNETLPGSSLDIYSEYAFYPIFGFKIEGNSFTGEYMDSNLLLKFEKSNENEDYFVRYKTFIKNVADKLGIEKYNLFHYRFYTDTTKGKYYAIPDYDPGRYYSAFAYFAFYAYY